MANFVRGSFPSSDWRAYVWPTRDFLISWMQPNLDEFGMRCFGAFAAAVLVVSSSSSSSSSSLPCSHALVPVCVVIS